MSWWCKCQKTPSSSWRAVKSIRHLHSGPEVIKACGKGAFSLSWRHFIAETTPPVRSEKKNREQKPATPAKWTVSLCCFPAQRSAAHCLYIQHLNTDWGYFLRQQKKPFRHLCSLCVTSNNEHIILRQTRDVQQTYNDVSPVMFCWLCSLL